MKEYITVELILDSQRILMADPVVTVQKNVSEHTFLTIRGIVKPESCQAVQSVTSMAEVQVEMGEEEGTLFLGLATYIDIQVMETEGNEYQEMYLEAMSYTCLLDQKRMVRAFQKKSAAHAEIVEALLKDYTGANYLFSSGLGKQSVGSFLVQYEETDWEFLVRLASRLHVPLVASQKARGVRFTVGAIYKDAVYEIAETEEDQIEIIHDATTGGDGNPAVSGRAQHYLRWQTDSPGVPVFEIGDGVLFKGSVYYVRETEAIVQDHVLKQICLLYKQDGFYVEEKSNQFLTGLSLSGSVTEVKNNELQITLDADAWDVRECWFIYSTFYSTFYCMPEKGDRINLYFPDAQEDHAFVLNSVQTHPKEAGIVTAAQTAQSTEGMQTGEPNIRDVTPYLAMLAAPEGGKLIDANITFAQTGADTGGPGGSTSAFSSKSNGKVRKDRDFQTMAQNKNIKVLSTKGGRMVILDDENGSVSIVCNDGTYIDLDEDGIFITTDKEITMKATEDLKLKAGESLILSAEKNVEISCGEAGIRIEPEKVMIIGTDILLNEEE